MYRARLSYPLEMDSLRSTIKEEPMNQPLFTVLKWTLWGTCAASVLVFVGIMAGAL